MPQRPDHRPAGRIKPLLSRAYDEVHLALWATLITALIFLGAFALPSMSTHEAAYVAARAHAVEVQDAFYCRRWGLVIGSGKHRTCMSDLMQLRRNVERQMADDSFF